MNFRVLDNIAFITGTSLAVYAFGWPTAMTIACFAYYVKSPWSEP